MSKEDLNTGYISRIMQDVTSNTSMKEIDFLENQLFQKILSGRCFTQGYNDHDQVLHNQ